MKIYQIIICEIQWWCIILKIKITFLSWIWSSKEIKLVISINIWRPPTWNKLITILNINFKEKTLTFHHILIILFRRIETFHYCRLIFPSQQFMKIITDKIELGRPIHNNMIIRLSIAPISPYPKITIWIYQSLSTNKRYRSYFTSLEFPLIELRLRIAMHELCFCCIEDVIDDDIEAVICCMILILFIKKRCLFVNTHDFIVLISIAKT